MEWFMNSIEWFTSNQGVIAEYLETALAFVGACAVIAAKTGSKVDDKTWGIASKILNPIVKAVNLAGMNLGKAKNKD